MEIKTSVLMPVSDTNHAGEAIRSILQQTYPHFTLLLAHDGSAKGVEDLARSFNDKRIQLLQYPENTGVASAFNWGLSEVDSPYIIRMDAQGISRPDRLAKQVEFMEQHPDVGVCGSFVSILDDSGAVREYPQSHKAIEAHLLFDNPIQHCSAILRSSLFQEKGFRYRDKYVGMEDHDLWIRLKQATKFANIDAALVGERVNKRPEHAAEWRERAFYFFVEKLPQFGIEPTSKELRLHIELSAPDKVQKFKSPLRYRAWLNRLKATNMQKRIFDPVSFDQVIEEKWKGLFPYILKQRRQKIVEYLHADGKSRWEIARFIIRHKIKNILGAK
jgi:glycosyltransferase involved in cell wall biosynthesis